MSLFERITSFLPAKLQPFAKAVFPFVGTVVAVLVQYLVTGEYDKAELTTTITGLASVLVTFLFPNIPPGDVDVQTGQPEGRSSWSRREAPVANPPANSPTTPPRV